MILNFQGYWRNSKWIFQRLIIEFLEVIKKIHVEFPGALVLDFKISEGCNTILWSFQAWGLALSGVSRGKEKNLKILGGLTKKYILNPSPFPPSVFFSGIA